MGWIEPVVLESQNVRLVPLSHEHAEGLRDAVTDGELWNLWYTNIPRPENVEAEIDRRLGLQKDGTMLPFTLIANDGRVLGVTTYMNIDTKNRRLEIGSTWYRRSTQRTSINTECKRLLLGHAFEQLDCIAVEFRTAFVNTQSRRAIERLGAKLDGVLRSHQIVKPGVIRDSCIYSILAHEWPTVKLHLEWQLAKPRE
jgi:RimJ/RimL family protein N-acetyltransferase